MKLFGTFNYERHIPIIFRLVQLTLVVICFLLSRYGGLFHLGADPPLEETMLLSEVGSIPCEFLRKAKRAVYQITFLSFAGGYDGRTNNYGEFVLSAHLYIFSILLVADFSRESAPLINLVVNLFGCFFFLVLSAIQFNSWRGLDAARENYRKLTGLYPFWHDPTIPRVMAFLAMLIGMLLIISSGLSVLILTKDRRRKKTNFHQEEDAEEGQSNSSKSESNEEDHKQETQKKHSFDDSGGISGSLGVPDKD